VLRRKAKFARNSAASNPESFRGWTLDVLNIVRRLVKERGVHAASSSKPPATLKRTEVRAPSEFTTADAYAFTPDKQHRGRSATLKTKSASNFKFCATPVCYCTSSVFFRIAGFDATSRVEMNDWLAPWR
jgi:hypothetical protein